MFSVLLFIVVWFPNPSTLLFASFLMKSKCSCSNCLNSSLVCLNSSLVCSNSSNFWSLIWISFSNVSSFCFSCFIRFWMNLSRHLSVDLLNWSVSFQSYIIYLIDRFWIFPEHSIGTDFRPLRCLVDVLNMQFNFIFPDVRSDLTAIFPANLPASFNSPFHAAR